MTNVRDLDQAPGQHSIYDAKHRDDRASVSGEGSHHRSTELWKALKEPQPSYDPGEDRVVDVIEIALRLRKEDDPHRRARRLT